MDLRSVWDSQQNFNFNRKHGSVECPLCGHDLSDPSELLRQLHTNDCLDRGDARETPDSMCIERSSLKGGNVDTVPVIEWLRDLDLSRYKKIFIRDRFALSSMANRRGSTKHRNNCTWTVKENH